MSIAGLRKVGNLEEVLAAAINQGRTTYRGNHKPIFGKRGHTHH